MPKIEPSQECNICYEEKQSKELFTCNNKNCDFKICKECGTSLVNISRTNKCPHCQQAIKHRHFTPIRRVLRGEVVNRFETMHYVNVWCFKIVERYPENNKTTINYRSPICFREQTDIDFSYNTDKLRCIASYVSCCITMPISIFIPKTIGYYMCSCKYNTGIYKAWKSAGRCLICDFYGGIFGMSLCGCCYDMLEWPVRDRNTANYIPADSGSCMNLFCLSLEGNTYVCKDILRVLNCMCFVAWIPGYVCNNIYNRRAQDDYCGVIKMILSRE